MRGLHVCVYIPLCSLVFRLSHIKGSVALLAEVYTANAMFQKIVLLLCCLPLLISTWVDYAIWPLAE